MKNFIKLFLTASVNAATGAVSAPLTSEKLDQLNVAYATAWEKMITFKDPRAVETKNAKLEVFRIEGEIKAEELALQKAVNDAKIAEQRNLRLKLNSNQLDAYAALIAIKADKKATAEAVQAAQTAFDTAKELVDNELLAKYAASKSAKPKADGETAETDKSSETKAAILEMFNAGKTHAEIEAAGYARSTVWHVIDKFKKANATV